MPGPDAHLRIEPMTSAHAADVLAIYQAGIEEGNATFETRAPDWTAFTAARLPAHRYVATAEGQVAGWVAASAVSGRCVYAGVVEHSVYVHPAARGRGIGRQLLDTLIASTEAAGIWAIQSGVFPENAASLVLHRAAGFRAVGTRERIGQHHGRWRDVILIERRSPALLPAPGQDRPQQPHTEHHPGHAGGHGHRRRPPDRRISRQQPPGCLVTWVHVSQRLAASRPEATRVVGRAGAYAAEGRSQVSPPSPPGPASSRGRFRRLGSGRAPGYSRGGLSVSWRWWKRKCWVG